MSYIPSVESLTDARVGGGDVTLAKREVFNTYKLGHSGKMVLHKPSFIKFDPNPETEQNQQIISELVGDLHRRNGHREYQIVRQ